jgi:hypothetical protein
MVEGLQIQIGANVSSAVQGLNQVQAELNQTEKDLVGLGNSVEKAAAKIRTLPTATGQATSTLTNFSRVVQDAPFGLIGIANNIDPLVSSFNQLKATTGSTGGAFKALIGQLAGPAGIALAISTTTSLLIAFGDRLFSSGSAAKELAEQSKKVAEAQQAIVENIGQERAEVDKLIILLKSENTTRGQKETILNKLKQINPQYFGDLKNEAGLVDNLTAAYRKYTASLVARSEVASLTKELEAISTEILKLEKAGATTEVIDLGLQRGLDGRLQTTKLLTKEQLAQVTLNTQLSAQLRERDRVLNAIAGKEQALVDDIKIQVKEAKVEPQKVKLSLPTITTIGDNEIEIPPIEQEVVVPLKNVQFDFYDIDKSKQLAQIKAQFEALGLQIPPINLQAIIQNPDILNQLNEQLDAAFQKFNQVSSLVGGTFAPAFDSLFSSIEKGGDAIGGFFDGLAQGIQQLVQALIQTAAIAGLVSLITGTPFASSFKLLSGITLPGRALGGPVSGGTPYLVGERGPELFVPQVSGGIVPNNSVGSFMSGRGSDSGRGSVLRGQDIILAYARTQRSQLRVNG